MVLLRITLLLLLTPLLANAEERLPADQGSEKKLAETRQIMAERAASRERGDTQSEAAESPSLIGASGKMLEGLALCIGVFLVGVHLYRRMSRTGTPGREAEVRVIGRTPLTAKTALVTVSIHGKEYVLAVGSEQVTALPDLGQDARGEPGSKEIELVCALDTPRAA